MPEKWRCTRKCYHDGRLYELDEIVTVHNPKEDLPQGRDPEKVQAYLKAGGDEDRVEREIPVEVRHFRPMARIEIPEGGDPEEADQIGEKELVMAELADLNVNFKDNWSLNKLRSLLVRAKGEPGGA